ncbi:MULTISPECIES: hypothetical protein [unclassified Corynebacterium]|uniref:hypothetical protein n=1 Tax=unclassified Corynebacterium TaxID=2624378 RepID=UPI0029CA74CC|nr:MULTISPECIES: hypothetical protein [unclassified Corynebacterium]WPF65820.1 hypothetical protein OLX12_09725 [Corynebacterium sp. 22KM0430]WPF68313.1 hypothetical protein OLW90_09720 [Corynebacterium sp. 21KM1197]
MTLRSGTRTAVLSGITGLALASALTACSTDHDEIVGPTWQVTGLYLDPQDSGDLPASAAGLAAFSFGETTVTGSTGCSRIRGIVHFSKEGSISAAREADTLAFEQIDVEEVTEDCQGGVAHVDSTLRSLLTGEYELSQPSEAELVLTQRSTAVDAPAIRLTTDAG